MIGFAMRKGAALRVSWVVRKQSTLPEQGGSHAQYTKGGTARHRETRPRIGSSHVGSFHLLAVCGDAYHRAPDRNQRPADSGPRCARPSSQLSSSVLALWLVQLEMGSRLGDVHSQPLASPGAGAFGRRRYSGRASRPEGLRGRHVTGTPFARHIPTPRIVRDTRDEIGLTCPSSSSLTAAEVSRNDAHNLAAGIALDLASKAWNTITRFVPRKALTTKEQCVIIRT
jgi:hypothetical protein